MSATTTKIPEYIYVSSNKRVRLILVDKSDGLIKVAGDVKSKSRPNIFHHARIEITDFLPALGRFPSSVRDYIPHLRGSREGQRPPPI